MINEFHQERIKFITFGRSQQNTSREAFLDLRRAEPLKCEARINNLETNQSWIKNVHSLFSPRTEINRFLVIYPATKICA